MRSDVVMRMTALFASSNLIRMAIAFATSVIVARGAGLEAFGQYTLMMVWASALTMMLDLGFGVLITREVAGTPDQAGSMVGGAASTRLVAFMPVALLVYAAGPWLLGGFGGRDAGAAVVVLAAAGIGYGSLGSAFRASPRWLATILGIETTGALAQGGGALWIVNRGGDVLLLVWLAAAIQLVQALAAVALWHRAMPQDPLSLPRWRASRLLLGRAVPFALAGLIANMQVRIAPLLLGVLATPAHVAEYGAAFRFQSAAQVLPHAGFAGALPAYAHQAASGRAAAMRPRIERWLQAFAIAAALTLVFAASPLVRAVYGEVFLAARLPLAWMGLGLIPNLVNGGRRVYLYALGRERTVVRWSTVTLGVQILGCLVLISPFGPSGAAAAMAAGEALVWWPLANACAKAGGTWSPAAPPSSSRHAPAPTAALLPPDAPAWRHPGGA